MAKLIYSAIALADGYVEDAAGGFDWGAPDEELLRFVNDLERPVGTYLYAPDVRDDVLLGDRPHGARPAVLGPGSSPASGRQPRRSCSQGHSTQCRAPGHGSSGTSIQA
jgi:hypothetical protein